MKNREYKSYLKFEELMNQKSMNIPKVSEELDIPMTSLYDWKNGNSKPKLEKLLKIAGFFGVNVSVFADAER